MSETQAPQAPQAVHANSTAFDFVNSQGYKSGFFTCYEDPVTCCATCCCSCLVVGHAVGKVNKTGFDLVSCFCSGIGAYRLRRAVQKMFNIQESEDASTVAIGLCGSCAVCQDVRELHAHGAVEPLISSAPKGQAPPTV
jgi:Cys-rich protein (TIGR01571 family)